MHQCICIFPKFSWGGGSPSPPPQTPPPRVDSDAFGALVRPRRELWVAIQTKIVIVGRHTKKIGNLCAKLHKASDFIDYTFLISPAFSN